MERKRGGSELGGTDEKRKVSPSSSTSIQHRPTEDLQHWTVKE